ncbi:MAG: amidohydrolase family protein, partial [Chloroflexota bacterium]
MTADGAVKITGIIDSDGHIFERDSEIQPYLGEGYQHDHLLNFPFFPTLDGWNRGALGAPSAERLAIGHPDAAAWVSFLDAYGLAATVLYPTAGLGAGFIKSPAWFIDLARGYNNYVHDRFLKASPRLKAVAMLPVLDPKAAAAELRRAVKELGMVGGLLPSIGLRLPYGDAAFDPLYAEAQALGTMLAVHGAPQQGMGFDFFESFGPGMVLEHPISQMIQFTSMITDKVFVRFPNLKVAFLEAGCGWAPYLIERIDQRAGGVASAQVRNSP